MYELEFESHIDDFGYSHNLNLQYERNICNRDKKSSLNRNIPTLKAEIQTINKNENSLKKQVDELNKKIELIFNKLKFNMEKEVFLKLKPRLLKNKKYVNTYVAIHNGEIVGFNDNKIELMKMIYNEIGYVPLYIDKITKEKTVYRLSSPKEIR